jgi:hypothetical protein
LGGCLLWATFYLCKNALKVLIPTLGWAAFRQLRSCTYKYVPTYNIGTTFFHYYVTYALILTKIAWATFWATFSQNKTSTTQASYLLENLNNP